MQWVKGNTMSASFNDKAKALKYLFVAEFADGSFIKQTPEDRSESFPFTLRSSFTDVLHRAGMHDEFKNDNPVPLVRFYLVDSDAPVIDGVVSSNNFYAVDFRTGWFQINDSVVWLGEELPASPEFKIVFYRRHREHQVQPAVYREPKSYKALSSGELQITNSKGENHVYPSTATLAEGVEEYEEGEKTKTRKVYHVWPVGNSDEIMYVLGWQCTIAGKNYQQTITVK